MRSDDDLAAALARVRALGPGSRASLTGGWVPAASGETAAGDDATVVAATADDTAAVVARLRARALSVAATGYSAAHGHPLDHAVLEPGSRRWRWLLSRRGAAAVGLVLALLVIVVVAQTSGRMPTSALPVQDPHASLVDSALGDPGAGASSTATAPTDAVSSGAVVTVHVVGQVRAPGVVRLPPGSRIADAVAAAGGATDEADVQAVNLARPAVDGEQVYVPARGEPARAAGVGSDPSGGSPGNVIDLNSADVAALDTLPGIGPVLAGRIIDWRKQHGRFAAVDELGEVAGIGSTLLGKLRDRVRV